MLSKCWDSSRSGSKLLKMWVRQLQRRQAKRSKEREGRVAWGSPSLVGIQKLFLVGRGVGRAFLCLTVTTRTNLQRLRRERAEIRDVTLRRLSKEGDHRGQLQNHYK